MCIRDRDYEGAVSDFSKAIKIKPDYAYALNNRASTLIRLEKYKEAVEDCNLAIAKNSDYAYAYYNRGIAKEMLRELDDACADWQKAESLGVEVAAEYRRVTCVK